MSENNNVELQEKSPPGTTVADKRKSTVVKNAPPPLETMKSELITTDTDVGLADMVSDEIKSARLTISGKRDDSLVAVPVPDDMQREQLDEKTESSWKSHRYFHPRTLVRKFKSFDVLCLF